MDSLGPVDKPVVKSPYGWLKNGNQPGDFRESSTIRSEDETRDTLPISSHGEGTMQASWRKKVHWHTDRCRNRANA